jgi:ribosomal protein S18 acetylase RimI-like enzyme
MIRTLPARPEDIDFLYHLYASTRLDEIRAWGWDETMQTSFLSLQWKAQRHSYTQLFPNSVNHIVLADEVRAGRMLTFRDGQQLRLIDIALLPKYRNQGIGTVLIRELQKEAVAATLQLCLSVLSTSPAVQLYHRLGFVKVSGDELYDSMVWG